jgi:hypothetical protein
MRVSGWWRRLMDAWPWRRRQEMELTPPPDIPSTRPEIEQTRARLDRASKRLLRMIDIEIEAQRRGF